MEVYEEHSYLTTICYCSCITSSLEWLFPTHMCVGLLVERKSSDLSCRLGYFHKADVPETSEEVEAFGVKLMKHGVSLLEYSRSLVNKGSYR